VTVVYNDPAYVLRRHGVPEAMLGNLAAASALIEAAACP
jgi:hypothetical protein